jgi:DNA-binding NarL/FixJ family response regulator
MRQNTADQPERINLVIVDDHQIFRQGVKLNLELQEDLRVVAECSNGEQALEVIRQMEPDVAIIDINLPLVNGIQVTRQLASEHLRTRYIMLTAYDDVQQVIHAMRAGASAYCAKEIEPDKLVEVIRHVNRGRYVVRDQIFDAEGIIAWIESGVESVAGQYYADMAESFSPLSGREMEILQYVTSGLSNKEIARTLKISHQTVKNHMTSILRKLAVEDRTQAAVFALRRGWVRLSDTGSRMND